MPLWFGHRVSSGKVWSHALARTLHDGGVVFVVVLTLAILCVEMQSQRPSLPRVT